jgi:hypothetical protein
MAANTLSLIGSTVKVPDMTVGAATVSLGAKSTLEIGGKATFTSSTGMLAEPFGSWDRRTR